MDRKKIFLMIYRRPYIEKSLELINKTTLIAIEGSVNEDIYKINEMINEIKKNERDEDVYALFKIAKRAIIFAHSGNMEEAAAHIFYKMWTVFSPDFSKFVAQEGAYDPFFLKATKEIVSFLHEDIY